MSSALSEAARSDQERVLGCSILDSDNESSLDRNSSGEASVSGLAWRELVAVVCVAGNVGWLRLAWQSAGPRQVVRGSQPGRVPVRWMPGPGASGLGRSAAFGLGAGPRRHAGARQPRELLWLVRHALAPVAERPRHLRALPGWPPVHRLGL